MVKAARGDALVERLDQLADVYGEVLLGLYDDLTDQRERTEAVAARADSVLVEARRIIDDMGTVAEETRAIEQRAGQLALDVTAPPPTPAGERVASMPPEALARLQSLETMAAALERSVQERTDAAVERSATLTAGLNDSLRAHVEQSVNDVRNEVQRNVTELRSNLQYLAEQLQRQSPPAAPPAPTTPAASVPAPAPAGEEWLAQVRREIDARSTTFSNAAQHAQDLASRLELIVRDAQQQLQDAKSDRAAAAFALRESRAELDAAKRAIDQSDYAFALDRLHRTERFLYATAVIAVLATLLSVWALVR
ncbi:MAG: hypothetical protein JWL83_2459 [Actinomycetia bacterium]|nr:hypothetical protein [Actinomycetes bacterium]